MCCVCVGAHSCSPHGAGASCTPVCVRAVSLRNLFSSSLCFHPSKRRSDGSSCDALQPLANTHKVLELSVCDNRHESLRRHKCVRSECARSFKEPNIEGCVGLSFARVSVGHAPESGTWVVWFISLRGSLCFLPRIFLYTSSLALGQPLGIDSRYGHADLLHGATIFIDSD